MRRVAASSFRRRHSSMPFSDGILMSVSTRSGDWLRTSDMAASPSGAGWTSYPSAFSVAQSVSSSGALSSATTILPATRFPDESCDIR